MSTIRVQKELLCFNNKTTQSKKWAKNLNWHFSKDTENGQQAHKKMSNITCFREMQIKTTVRYHFIPARMVTIKKKKREERGRKEEVMAGT